MVHRMQFLFLVWLGCATIASAQKIKNDFFTLHNIIRGDSTYNTFDKQVELVKKAGFDGIEINQVDSFEGMKAALDKHQFTGSYFYIKLKLEEPYVDKRVAAYIQQLKGTNTIISPFIVSESKRFKPSSHDADTLVVRLVRKIADWAKEADLEEVMKEMDAATEVVPIACGWVPCPHSDFLQKASDSQSHSSSLLPLKD